MTISEILLQDFDAEMRNTRTTLERIPEDKPDFKPHEKSMPCGRLAMHVATLPYLGTAILTTDMLDVAVTKSPRLFFNHLIHHRAQLGVYLRLNNLPVPPLYGPSADDSMGF